MIFLTISDAISWAKKLLQELQELKALMKEEKRESRRRDRKFYAFLKEFRRSMRADVDKNLYPKIIYYKGLWLFI